MKLKTTLLAATLAAFAATAAFAANEQSTEAKAVKAENPKAEKAETKKVKKHNHAAERNGMAMPETAKDASHRDTMSKDMPMHDHTMDRH